MAACVVGDILNLFGKVIHLAIDEDPDTRFVKGRYKLGDCANTLTPKALTKGLSEKNGRGLPDRSVWTFEARTMRSME